MFKYLLISSLLLVPGLSVAESIYKSKDEYGNTIFSDQGSEDAKKVKVQKPSTYDSSGFLEPSKGAGNQASDSQADMSYSVLSVTTMDGEESVRENAGNLDLFIRIEPAIYAGHSVQLIMDGEFYSSIGGTGPLTLPNVDRGTHTFELQVVRINDNQIIEYGPPATVTVLRHFQQNPVNLPSKRGS